MGVDRNTEAPNPWKGGGFGNEIMLPVILEPRATWHKRRETPSRHTSERGGRPRSERDYFSRSIRFVR